MRICLSISIPDRDTSKSVRVSLAGKMVMQCARSRCQWKGMVRRIAEIGDGLPLGPSPIITGEAPMP